MITANNNTRRCGQKTMLVLGVLLLMLGVMLSSQADGTAPCNVGTGMNSTECGVNATASNSSSTALGRNSTASGGSSTALGRDATASGGSSTALGRDSTASADTSTALGYFAQARSEGATSIGSRSGFNNNVAVTDSPQAIAIGHYSNITAASPGAIAIGGDVNGDGVGAHATAPGAIAIGADVVANKANTMSVGVPIEVKRDDGTTQLLVNEKSAGNAVRTLFNVVCDTCTPGFRFHQTFPSNNTWNFRMLQSGAFSVDDPATSTKEAEFRSGGDLKIGGSLIQASSREIKTEITELQGDEILAKLDHLSISEWSYKKDQGNVKHIGPMSEDFHMLFNVGIDNKSISSIDTSGVALAAIKALNQKVSEIDDLISEIDELRKEKETEIALLKVKNQALVSRLESVESRLTRFEEVKWRLTDNVLFN